MTLKDRFLSLQFLFKPSYWMMQGCYSSHWDAKLNELMAKHTFRLCDGLQFSTILGDTVVWTANHPYASFGYCSNGYTPNNERPSRLTISRAARKLRRDLPNYYLS